RRGLHCWTSVNSRNGRERGAARSSLAIVNYECKIRSSVRFAGSKVGMAVTVMPGLERRLRAEVAGDVLFDDFSRGRYSTDASHYQEKPVGVVVPRRMQDAERAISLACQEGVPVTARGGGTSQCGQTVNRGLI